MDLFSVGHANFLIKVKFCGSKTLGLPLVFTKTSEQHIEY